MQEIAGRKVPLLDPQFLDPVAQRPEAHAEPLRGSRLCRLVAAVLLERLQDGAALDTFHLISERSAGARERDRSDAQRQRPCEHVLEFADVGREGTGPLTLSRRELFFDAFQKTLEFLNYNFDNLIILL